MIVYKEGILFNGFPPPGRLILRELSERSPKSESNFGVKITSKRGTFGILEEFKLNNLTPTSSLLWMEAMRNEGGLENYSCESEIQNYVKRALTDCIDIGGFRPSFGVYLEVCCSPAAVMARGKRVCTNFFLKDTLAKTGVVEVKLPGFDFDHINQIVDSMIDLRNSANVRYVFGVLTTYKAWKILWFEDSNDAAVTTSKRAYEELCMAEVAHEYDISQKVTVYQSQLYEHSDLSLVECLVSLLYKMGKSPIYQATKYIDSSLRYAFANQDSILYRELPKELLKFSLSMPSKQTRNFFMLSDFNHGGDGSVVLCCSSSGNLGVFKFLNHGDTAELAQEQSHWDNLWGVECRIVKLNNRDGLLMPFCFSFNDHNREDGNAWFSLE